MTSFETHPSAATADSLDDLQKDAHPSGKKTGKGSAFWMIMLSLAISTFLSALDLTAITTVSLPNLPFTSRPPILRQLMQCSCNF